MIDKGMDAYCGLCCATCEYRTEFGCGGCVATGGHPFYGECALAQCAIKHKVDFCGECPDFCCEMLHKYSYDEAEGDNPKGARIERCKMVREALVKYARQGRDTLGRCGQHCDYCLQKEWCGGCRSGYDICSYAHLFDDRACQNRVCSYGKKLKGCFECDEVAHCTKGFYSEKSDFIAKVSAIFIQKYGRECFEETLKKAIDSGYEYPKAFNQAGSLRAVMEILERFRMQDDLF